MHIAAPTFVLEPRVDIVSAENDYNFHEIDLFICQRSGYIAANATIPQLSSRSNGNDTWHLHTRAHVRE